MMDENNHLLKLLFIQQLLVCITALTICEVSYEFIPL